MVFAATISIGQITLYSHARVQRATKICARTRSLKIRSECGELVYMIHDCNISIDPKCAEFRKCEHTHSVLPLLLKIEIISSFPLLHSPKLQLKMSQFSDEHCLGRQGLLSQDEKNGYRAELEFENSRSNLKTKRRLLQLYFSLFVNAILITGAITWILFFQNSRYHCIPNPVYCSSASSNFC